MIWALLACTADPVPETVDSASLPSVERPAAEAVWTAAQAQAELEELLSHGFPSPWRGMEIYFELLSHGDDFCPGHDDHIDDSHLRGCDADSGWWYSGVSSFEEGTLPANEIHDIHYQAAIGDFLFKDPTGQEFECGGHQSLMELLDDGVIIQLVAEHQGSYVWEGDDGVFREPVSGALRTSLEGETGNRQISLEGAIQYLGRSVYFRARLSERCDWGVAQGELALRDPSGGWISWAPEACEPCATATFSDGTELGEMCVDLRPIATAFAEPLELLP